MWLRVAAACGWLACCGVVRRGVDELGAVFGGFVEVRCAVVCFGLVIVWCIVVLRDPCVCVCRRARAAVRLHMVRCGVVCGVARVCDATRGLR